MDLITDRRANLHFSKGGVVVSEIEEQVIQIKYLIMEIV